MSGILYDDLVAVHITKLQALINDRTEPYTEGTVVSNSAPTSERRMVSLTVAGGLGQRETIDTEYHAVNVYADNEADAADLTAMVRALITSRGISSLCDGHPIVFTAVNVHPVPVVPTADGYWRWRMVVELRRRGTQI